MGFHEFAGGHWAEGLGMLYACVFAAAEGAAHQPLAQAMAVPFAE
jgi:hypothetical protein